MSKPGFTPGPWSFERVEYDKYGLDASYEINAGFQTIAQTHMREIKTESGQLRTDEANCRLIAAAPTLLEALEEWLEAVGPAAVQRARQKAVAAINAATGGQQ